MQRVNGLDEKERANLQNLQAEFEKLTKTPNPQHAKAQFRVDKYAELEWIDVEREEKPS